MKQRLLLAFFALSLFITSCGSDNGLDGNWKKSAEYSGSGRGGAVSFTIGDDVYVGLGYSNGDYFSSFYKYNTTIDNWTSITEKVDGNEIGVFPGTPRREAVAFSVNGKGYIGTGVDEDGDRLNDFWEYDPTKPVAERWSELTSQFPGGIRQGAVAFAFNDIAYVGTGYGVLDGEDQNNLKDFYKFENGVWSESLGYGGSKTTDATTFVIGDKAYLVSGKNNLDNVWEFNSTSETWKQLKDIDKDNGAEDVQRTSAVSFVIDGKGYITTGLGSSSREVWEYNVAKDDWVERTSLENEVISRVDAIGFSIDNRGFIVTGLNGQTGLSDMWEFQPKVGEDDDDND
ncbi:Kelch repeat-containing protein [Ancylomarina sp.]|uniref:Kelch repeat-containing protein n=1 Tax=Ancylomarina sp. TaxID=1970196 RepID=UPI0035664FEB